MKLENRNIYILHNDELYIYVFEYRPRVALSDCEIRTKSRSRPIKLIGKNIKNQKTYLKVN